MNNWLDKYEQGGMVLKQKTKDNYGKKANPNNPDVSLPPGFKGLAYNTKGRNYSPAWGGQFQYGGSIIPTSREAYDAFSKEYNEFYTTKVPYLPKRDDGFDDFEKYKTKDLKQVPRSQGSGWLIKNDDSEMFEPSEKGEPMPKKLQKKPGTKTFVEDYIMMRDNPMEQYYNSLLLNLVRKNAKTKYAMLPSYESLQDGGNLMPAMAGANQTIPMYQMGGNLFNTNKTAWVDSIHNARKGDLNFVQRMFDQRAGSIQIPGQRGTSTHFMESGDKRAYPTVVQMPNGKLQYLNQNDKDAAWNYAKRTKQFIQFPTDEQAEWYANDGYKKGTGVLEKKQMGGSIPGAVGFTYARTVGAAPSNGPYAKKTKASAQNGQEMKYYQEGLDFKPKTISKNGGWLDKFDTAQGGGTFMDKVDADIAKLLGPNTDKNRSRGDIASYFPEIRKAQEKPEIDKTIAKADQKRKQSILAEAVANAKGKQATVKQDNRTSREKEIAQQELVNLKRDEALRNSPLAQTMGSFTPSGDNPGAGAIGAEAFVNMNPLITGPFLSGTRLYGQAKGDNPYGFGESTLGNIMGAVGLMGDVGFLKSAAPTGRIAGKNTYKNFVDQQSSKKLPSPSPEPNLEVLPRGNYLESDLVAGKKITMNDVDKIAKKEMDWLQSDEYFKRRSAATGESASEIQKDVDKIFENWKNISVEAGKTKKNVGGYYNRANDKIVIGNTLDGREEGLSVLDHEVKHAFSQLGGLKYRGGYKNYPTTDVGNWLTKAIDYADTQYYAEPWEQQVRGLRLLDYINETQGIPRGTTLTMENIDEFAKSVSPSSESGKGFWNKYGDVGQQLVKMKEADRQLKFIPSNIKQGKFPFKFQQKGELRKNILDWLNKTYAIPVGVGLGAGALGSDEEVPQKQDGGDIPIDPDGYWNPENWGNPVIIPSTDITMEGVGQPLVGISDTGDIQYMEPGEDYEFDGEYVTEYPVAKKGISVNNADAQPIKKLDQSLNFTNYNKPTKGGWLDKYN